MPEQKDFRDKVVVVTGGAMGIGYAAAKRFAAGGASVVIGDVSPHLADVIDELKRGGADVGGKSTDVTSPDDLSELMEFARSTRGGVDVLINSAGIETYGTVVDTAEEVWDLTMSTNLKSMYLAAKFAIPLMRLRGGGAVVNVASVQAFATQVSAVAYATSKAGILGLTRAMALDHAREGIRVNSVCPGSIDTPMLRAAAALHQPDRSADDVVAEWGHANPVGRVGTADEVADLIAFLASDRARFVTGAEYKIDGGLLAGLPVAKHRT
jgi:NAD(P)-dependent dehydrogenase (short-subunit alcohol dehydrogenase family)